MLSANGLPSHSDIVLKQLEEGEWDPAAAVAVDSVQLMQQKQPNGDCPPPGMQTQQSTLSRYPLRSRPVCNGALAGSSYQQHHYTALELSDESLGSGQSGVTRMGRCVFVVCMHAVLAYDMASGKFSHILVMMHCGHVLVSQVLWHSSSHQTSRPQPATHACASSEG